MGTFLKRGEERATAPLLIHFLCKWKRWY